MAKNLSCFGAFVLVAAAALGLLLVLDPLAAHRAYVVFTVMWFPVLLLVVVAGLGLLAGSVANHHGFSTAGVIGGAALFIGVLLLRGWNASTFYADLPQELEDQASFSERAPYTVADRSADSATSGINGDRRSTKYLAEANTYTPPVTGRGFITPGYLAVIEQEFDLDGRATTSQCRFSEDAQRWVGGLLHHSLERAVARKSRTAMFSASDAWTYCEDDKPYVVMPLTRYSGILNLHHVPAGVAIYDGHTGEVEIREDVKSGELPGPVISQSYAERIEAAMGYRDRTGFISVMLGQTGFETAGGEEGDPNSENPGNHQLAYVGGGMAHVTPLTRVSTSTAVERLLTVDAGEVAAGEHPTVSLRVLDPARESNAVMEQNIRSQFDQVNWASGLTVQEITPGPDGAWVASIGQRTNVAYRVTLDTEDQWHIEDLRTTNVIGKDEDTESEPRRPAGRGLPEVDELTDEQLADLGQLVIEELSRRGTRR
ncbi:hypothetical protein [Nesterenkonia rhizosphaerae]|uniref:Uncharacterized protein n=1 Tax=Nesterenkonia rhizosphaerae TaxID=1348272 RepID=A0ABP9G129_9MICC